MKDNIQKVGLVTQADLDKAKKDATGIKRAHVVVLCIIVFVVGLIISYTVSLGEKAFDNGFEDFEDFEFYL